MNGELDVEQLRRLTAIGRALTYATSLEQVAELATRRGATLLDATASVLMLADEHGQMQVRAAHGVEAARLARFRAPQADEMVDRLRGLLDVADDGFLAVPLVVSGAVTGIVGVALARPARDTDEWLLSALADQASVALESARLAGEVRLDMEERLRTSEGTTSAMDRALATLAHDIRTPLGAIDGYCSNLQDDIYGPISAPQRKVVERVRMSGRHLMSLLDNVMDLVRLNTGSLAVLAAPVRLVQVAGEAVALVTPASEAKLQTLVLAPGADVVVTGDQARIRQVLVNLLGNAVKFTPERGRVTVTTAAGASDGVPWGEVRVSDTGPGIAEAEQAAVFAPYYRSADVAKAPGVGLGLAISLALAVQMRGALTLESELGAGSSFALRLPVHGHAAA